MEFDFETLVHRNHANLKQRMLSEQVAAAGNISFDGAEPDFKTAPVIEEAVIRLARNGLYGFTVCDDAYRDAVVWWMRESRGVAVEPDWLVTTLGTIYSVATAIRLCTEEGEGVIVTSPVYNRYRQAADRLYRRTVDCPLRLENGRYAMDFEVIEEAMRDPRNRLFVLCNPHNPIGQVWSRQELCRLAELADAWDVTVFSDEIFADNCYGGRRCPCYLEIPKAKKHGIVCTSLGKAFGFTGVNHANVLIADADLRRRFEDRRTRDHYGSLDPFVYECVLAAYSAAGKAWLDASNAYVEANIDKIRAFFQKNLPKVGVYGGEGAYVLWLDWRAYFRTEEELMRFLRTKACFELGEGSEYGAAGFARMCAASPWRCIERALATLLEAWEAQPRG